MTFVMAFSTNSVATLGALVPAWSLVVLPSARDEGTGRIKSLTPGLHPHLTENGVGMLGLLVGADPGGWEDIIV